MSKTKDWYIKTQCEKFQLPNNLLIYDYPGREFSSHQCEK